MGKGRLGLWGQLREVDLTANGREWIEREWVRIFDRKGCEIFVQEVFKLKAGAWVDIID
jgi:hypothetical protein